MGVEIVINPAPEETRVALIENQILTELYIDRKRDRGIVGNVYKGRVVKVLPGMQASFVDIGVERAAFLYVADITTATDEDQPPSESEPPEVADEGEGADEGAQDREEPEDETAKAAPRRGRAHRSIEELLKEGQEIVVQVTKDPIGTKGCRVTTYLSLPGRYLVYMPTVNHIGISRRIGDEAERARLREMMMRLRQPGAGYIIRTVSEGTSEDEFRMDVEFLERLWQTIRDEGQRRSAPALLHASPTTAPSPLASAGASNPVSTSASSPVASGASGASSVDLHANVPNDVRTPMSNEVEKNRLRMGDLTDKTAFRLA